MLLYVSRKVTVPPVSGTPPDFTVAVKVNTDPLAAVVGFTERVVVVACAPAMAQDIVINKATPREVRGFLRWVALSRAFAFLELSNILLALPEVCGRSIASERNDARKLRCKNKHLTAATGGQRVFHVVLADDTDWQKRSGNGALRETFMHTGISKPFD